MESRLRSVGAVVVLTLLSSLDATAQEPSDPPQRRYAPGITVSETHVGLTGFVLDSSGAAVPDAEVRAFPDAHERSDESLMRRSHHFTRSGEKGGFFMPLAPGSYALRVNRPGYGVTRMHVMVPPAGGRCVAIWLLAPGIRPPLGDRSCDRL